MKMQLSPKELSRAVGVSESSLKRWVDDGQLQAVRTAGGHRRISIEEAIRFIRETGLRVVEPDAIGLSELVNAANSDGGEPGNAFMDALLDGDDALVRGMLLHAYMNGHTIAEICDHVIAPSMHRIGELWRHDEKGIFLEHRATHLCVGAMHQLRSILPPTSENAPVAIGGAIGGDIYTLPTLMAAVALASQGWKDMNLGSDTPSDSLFHAARSMKPRLVWLSISVDRPEEDLKKQINWLAERLEPVGAALIVGGRHGPTRKTGLHVNAHIASTMSELTAFAAGLKTSAAPRGKV